MKRSTLSLAIVLVLAVGVPARSPQSEIRGLSANGPAHEYADKMMLFGQFVGDWEFDLISIHPDGTRSKGNGEWHFGWALQGRAVQDVWIARDDISKGEAPISEWGTTVRFLDAKRDLWRVVWAGPMRGSLITFTGKKIGDEIVMEVDSVQGLPRVNCSAEVPVRRGQWIFDHITSNSFHWRAVTSQDGGKTWKMEQEMFVRRMKTEASGGATIEPRTLANGWRVGESESPTGCQLRKPGLENASQRSQSGDDPKQLKDRAFGC